MYILSIILYAVALFVIFKFVKNDILELGILIGITIACKFLAGDGSFYPLFAMPVLLALRHNKPYSFVYTLIIVTFVNLLQGFGSWSIGQYLIYGLISIGTYLIRNKLVNTNKLVVFGYNFVVMFVFGVLMDVFTFYTGNFLGYSNVIEQVIAGLPFDLKYGISGIAFGSLSMAAAYLTSVNVKDILNVKSMTLVKQHN